MKKINNFDRLNEGFENADNFLLLHPRFINGEQKKIKRKSLVYRTDKDDSESLFIPKIPIDNLKVTQNLIQCIPYGVTMMLGDLDSKYKIRVKKSPKTDDRMFEVFDSEDKKSLLLGSDLKYFGANYAQISNFVIMQDTILFHEGEVCHFTNSGYVLLTNESKIYGGSLYTLYDSRGNFVAMDVNRERLLEIGNNAPNFMYPSLTKDAHTFESMILTSLNSREELQDMHLYNLSSISDYLSEKGLDLTVNLDSLEVYKTDYKKFLSKKKKY